MKRNPARLPDAIEFAARERATANEFAATVWQWVRGRRICGQKFRREYPIPPYTVDFCCVELKLILEVDGAEHFGDEGQKRDRVRDEFLNGLDYRVIRIHGYEVLREPEVCLERIIGEVRRRVGELGSDG